MSNNQDDRHAIYMYDKTCQNILPKNPKACDLELLCFIKTNTLEFLSPLSSVDMHVNGGNLKKSRLKGKLSYGKHMTAGELSDPVKGLSSPYWKVI